MRSIGVALALFVSLPMPAQEPVFVPTTFVPELSGPRAPATEETPFRLDHVSAIPWRSIGPANMGGRIVDIDVHASQPTVWYLATASGGLWKTENAGTTWQALFQHQPTVSIGDVAVAPSNPAIVWVGTGEENARNSVSWGDGIYKSTDGGKSWKHMGLAPTFQIGHIAIDPREPDTVFVAALGRLWGHNEERGVFRTLDGGTTWEKVLYLDERTGCMDVRIDPNRPSTVYAAMYERRRDGFDSNDPQVRLSETSGLYRSDDGGQTWKKLSRGLPTCKWGRTGLEIWDKNPDTVFAIVETERSGWASGTERTDPDADTRVSARTMGMSGEDAEKGARLTRLTPNGAATAAGLVTDDIVVQWGDVDIGSYRALEAALRSKRADSVTRVTVMRGGEKRQVDVTHAAAATRQQRGRPYMGINGEDAADGARLTMVTPSGPSDRAGLTRGDVVLQIGDQKVASYREMLTTVRAANAGDKLKLTILRDGAKREIDLTLGSRDAAGGAGAARAGAGGRGGFGGRGGGRNGPHSGRLGGQAANVHEEQGEKGYETGGIFRSDDRGDTWRRINSLTDRPFYYSVLVVDPQDDKNLYHCGLNFWASFDGGQEFKNATRGVHGDFHAVWVNPTNSDHLILGCDGGFNVTYDRCKSWEVINNIPIGQFYHADTDNSVPYRVYGGLQDNGTWGGPSQTRFRNGITKADWHQIYSGDGFRAHVDPTDPAVVYATSQNGNLGRVDLRTGGISRVQRPRGSQFNWDTPFFLSPHNPRILYFAGNHAFRSLDRGENSVQLTKDPIGLTERGTATAMAESRHQPGLLYVGTDDGALWRTFDGGHTWEEIHAKLLDMPGPRYVSSIHTSQFSTQRVYVTFDGHRSDDFETHVYVSEDAGDTWTNLIADLPDEPCHVVREDPGNEDLLFLGTEFSCYVSLDRGDHWMSLGTGLPTVAVRDLAIQNRDADLIAATHGRSIWIADIAPLRALTAEVAAGDVHLFAPETATLWQLRSRSSMGQKEWRSSNPPYGATIYALFDRAPAERPEITIHDVTGAEVARVRGAARAGLQRFIWDARTGNEASADTERPAGRGRRRGRRRPVAPPGSYSVRLAHGDETLIQPLTLVPDPLAATSPSATTTPSRN